MTQRPLRFQRSASRACRHAGGVTVFDRFGGNNRSATDQVGSYLSAVTRSSIMARAYYSTVIEQPADRIWAIIRDFNAHSVWLPGTESHIEERKSGDQVGAIRNVRIGEKVIRQRLLAESDIDRFQTYEFCGPAPFPVRNYRATLRLTPIVDGNRSFIEWWATFDCAPEQHEHWTAYFANDGFAKWLGSLRNHLSARDRETPASTCQRRRQSGAAVTPSGSCRAQRRPQARGGAGLGLRVNTYCARSLRCSGRGREEPHNVLNSATGSRFRISRNYLFELFMTRTPCRKFYSAFGQSEAAVPYCFGMNVRLASVMTCGRPSRRPLSLKARPLKSIAGSWGKSARAKSARASVSSLTAWPASLVARAQDKSNRPACSR
jgi:hypothetical protein